MPNIFTLESSFAGLDFGKSKGKHLSTSMLESVGKDLCRTLLILTKKYVPPDLRNTFKMKPKDYSEDQDDTGENFLKELEDNKDLMKFGDGESSGGSDSAPSDDNLP